MPVHPTLETPVADRRSRHILLTFAVFAACLWVAAAGPARAQFLGHNFHGDYGVLSATQPTPGAWLSPMYLRYDGDTLRNRNGDPVMIDPERRGEIDVSSYVLGLWYVTESKLLGGSYSFALFPALTDNTLEAPILELNQRSSTGWADLYIQPINLGWNTERADFMAGLGVYAPVGRYDVDADDNLGLGMWSVELFGGATLYFDRAKRWHFATSAFYETHTEKKDTDITVGDILTLEGGLGRSWMEGAVTVGVAYYAQWKMTDDDLGIDFELPGDRKLLGRHRVYGFGPDVTIPIATKKNLIAFLNLRYFWESGARTTLEGNTFTFAATFPVPSIQLQ